MASAQDLEGFYRPSECEASKDLVLWVHDGSEDVYHLECFLEAPREHVDKDVL